jgi:DNA-binding SARP family transcriptional activator
MQNMELSSPILALHPKYRNRYKLLPSLLTQRASMPIYILVQTPNTLWEAFWGLLQSAMCEQAACSLPALPENATPEAAAAQLCRHLVGQPYSLIVDSADNLDQGSCSPFWAALVQGLPKHTRIVLIGRTWLTDLVGRLPTSAVACYPISESDMLYDYRATPANGKLLEVYAHADQRVFVNGIEVNTWEGQLPRILFHFFVDRGIATRDEIFQTFWSDLPTREATNVFHVTKRKVHEILGFNLTIYQNGYYCIAPEIELRYDTSRFLELVNQSEIADTDDAIKLLESAVRLYRNDFLRGLSSNWIEARRTALRNQLAEAYGSLGRLYERTERDMQAISAYERALAIQPYREDWARNLMSLYAMYRQAGRGVAVFERLERALQQQMGKVKLDKRTQELAAKLRRML